jgi:hypothetical protein
VDRQSTIIYFIRSRKKMNFVLTEMTFLRYFMPLIIEGTTRGITSRLLIHPNGKYNNPHKYNDFLTKLSEKHNFLLEPLSDIDLYRDTTFLVEGCGSEFTKKNKTISLTYQTDFSLSYDKYINRVDKVVFPSKFFAKYYKTLSDKNLYLGSPKYDVVLDSNKIYNKYNIGNSRCALVVFPRRRDMKKVNLEKIYNRLEEAGYTILVKTRGKDPAPEELQGHYYFEDDSWYPHTTMELMKISDIIINFGSTAIKESVLLTRPVVNFNIKPFELPLDFLYNEEYCVNLSPEADMNSFSESIESLTTKDLSAAYKKAMKKYLFVPGSVSKRILDEVL